MTIDKVKAYLGVYNDVENELLEMLLSQATAIVNGFIGQSLELAEREYGVRLTACQRYLFPPFRPIVSIESLSLNGVEQDTELYEVVNGCQIGRVDGSVFYAGRYEIVVESGYETIPSDYELGILKIVANLYGQRGSVQSEGSGDQSVGYHPQALTPEIQQLLFPYKVGVIC